MYPNIRDINALSPAEHAKMYSQLKRRAVKNILTFAAIKAALYIFIAYTVKKANDRP